MRLENKFPVQKMPQNSILIIGRTKTGPDIKELRPVLNP